MGPGSSKNTPELGDWLDAYKAFDQSLAIDEESVLKVFNFSYKISLCVCVCVCVYLPCFLLVHVINGSLVFLCISQFHLWIFFYS